jgi:hypothetical protein
VTVSCLDVIISTMTRICITPFVQGTGGMASFRLKFEQGLLSRGIDVTYDLSAKLTQFSSSQALASYLT